MKFKGTGLLCWGLLFFVSCATSPKKPAVDEDGEFAFLAPGAAAYISMDVPRARPLLEFISLGGFSGKDAGEFLDKTNFAVVAAYPSGSGRSFMAAARGKYPHRRINFSFAFNPYWKKRPSAMGGSYWRSDWYDLSIFLTSHRALVSDGDPLISPSGIAAPPEFAAFRRGALLAGWTDEGGAPVNQFLALLEIPLQIPADRIFFSIYDVPEGEAGKDYEAFLRIETPSVNHAKGLASLFSLTRIFMADLPPADEGDPLTLAAALFANIPSQEAAALIIRTGSLSPQGIALLFNMLSLYSN